MELEVHLDANGITKAELLECLDQLQSWPVTVEEWIKFYPARVCLLKLACGRN